MPRQCHYDLIVLAVAWILFNFFAISWTFFRLSIEDCSSGFEAPRTSIRASYFEIFANTRQIHHSTFSVSTKLASSFFFLMWKQICHSKQQPIMYDCATVDAHGEASERWVCQYQVIYPATLPDTNFQPSCLIIVDSFDPTERVSAKPLNSKWAMLLVTWSSPWRICLSLTSYFWRLTVDFRDKGPYLITWLLYPMFQWSVMELWTASWRMGWDSPPTWKSTSFLTVTGSWPEDH